MVTSSQTISPYLGLNLHFGFLAQVGSAKPMIQASGLGVGLPSFGPSLLLGL